MVVAALATAAAPLLFDGTHTIANPLLAMANLAPWLLLWLLLFAISRRPLASALVVNALAATACLVNDLKMRNLGLPLMPADLGLARQLLSSPELYWRYLPNSAWWLLAAVLLPWLALRERPTIERRSITGMTTLGLAAVAALSLHLRWQPWRALYDPERLQIDIWAPASAVRSHGFTAYFLLLAQNTQGSLPEPDSHALAEYSRRFPSTSTQQTPASSDVLPDILVLQSESFFDPADLAGIDAAPLIPELIELRKRHAHGRLRVPTFGGLTIRTEFEFLSGFPLRTAPTILYPYQGMLNGPVPALPWTLKRHGYRTHALHPYDHRFYSRDRVYPWLGFDIFHSASEFSPGDTHGYFTSDQALKRRLLELLDDGAPQFVFAVSMENHGPWDDGRDIPPDQLPALATAPPTLSPSGRVQLQRFLHHLQRSDAMLGALARWVERRERPTVLLFFGDHLPNLLDTFASWPFANGEPADRQTVPWLLVDNRKPSSERSDLDSSQLAALLLARSGVADDPLFSAIEQLRVQQHAIGASQRLRWQHSLAAARLREPVKQTLVEPVDGELASLLSWGPRGAEVDPSRQEAMTLHARFDAPLTRSAFISIGERRLQTLRRSGGLIEAMLEPTLAAGLLAAPGNHPAFLIDPLRGIRQKLGDFVVREPAPRLGAVLGFGGGPFCAVEAWGPQSVSRTTPTSRLPDGRVGVWVKAACLPRDVRIRINGNDAPTMVDDRVATAAVDLQDLSDTGTISIELGLGSAAMAVGELLIAP